MPIVYEAFDHNIFSEPFFRTVMLMPKKSSLHELDREHLLSLLEYFRSKLGKKADRLNQMRTRLNNARSRIDKLKATVEYQRTRIMELMERDTAGNAEGNRSERIERG
jgi:chromosome segregation ATPase